MGMLALLATGPFDSADGGTGLLLGARGLGVVAGPFIARRLLARRSPRRSVMAGTAVLLTCGAAGLVYAAGYLVVGTAPVLAVAVAGALLAHLGGGAQWTLSTYGLQSAVPDYIRGRVFAADFALRDAHHEPVARRLGSVGRDQRPPAPHCCWPVSAPLGRSPT